MSARSSFGGDRTLPMTVKNTGFLVDRLGQDCHPLQFLRELTQNATEAIAKAGEPGQVSWDVDWNSYDLQDTGVMRLSITDNGVGMTGPEMVEHINKLSSSGAEQSFEGNYGVGAKIAAATRNHAGMVYLSWKNGHGAMIHLWRNPDDGTYGLRQQAKSDGTFGDFLELDDAVKPEIIGMHGTMIVLYGKSEEENTIDAPPGAPAASRWIAKYLNTRYFRFQPGVTLRAREGWSYPRSDKDRNTLRSLMGQERYLREHAATSGEVKLSDGAVAHWWVLKDEDAIKNNSGYIESSGHIAALYQNELYEMSTGRSGTAKLQQFGIIFGMRQVVIYVEPPLIGGGITTNTARTSLLIKSEPLPWTQWAADFRDNMPEEIERLINEKAAGASSGDAQTLRDRLKPILDLFRVSRYRPSAAGDLLIDDQAVTRGGRLRAGTTATGDGGADGATKKSVGTTGNIYSLFEKRDGKPGEKTKPDPFPKWNWISTADGTREAGDLEDRAARFHMDQNLLLINADFRVFTDMVAKWHKELGGGESILKTVEDVVQTWFTQALVETVMGVQALQGAKEWPLQMIQAAVSEEALTTAVMQRYHINYNIKRELGAKLGRLQSA